ncbi:MAG TPA: DUF4936 family protein [Caldimonas sp.]
MRELFVWYRVRRHHVDAARMAVDAMRRSLAQSWPGLQARLLIRADGEPQTWMETYARDGGDAAAGCGIDRELEAAIAAAAQPWSALIEGERHAEAFELAHEL